MAFESSERAAPGKSADALTGEYQKVMARIAELDGPALTKEEARELGLAQMRAGALRRELGLPDPFEEEPRRAA